MNDAPPIHILYIDDDPGLCRLAQRHLERAGFRVTTETRPDRGLARARDGGFDAIALDHYMPGHDGLALLDELGPVRERTPVLFVTAAEEPAIAVAALKAGAADYVVKDVRGLFLDRLAAAVRLALDQVRMRREKDAAEQALRDSLVRLETLTTQQALLLREVNHRVANSLQLITSLIGLQARHVADPAARATLQQAIDRVEAVTLVHRRLYTSSDVELVRMDQYLTGLVEELGRTVERDGGPGIRLLAEPVSVATDTAVSIGLIVNELVTNAVKYAYPGGRGGEVRVRFGRRDAGRLQLVVEDDGIGMAGDAAPRGSGLGGTIVRAMAAKLGAALHQDTGHAGTRFDIEISGQ